MKILSKRSEKIRTKNGIIFLNDYLRTRFEQVMALSKYALINCLTNVFRLVQKSCPTKVRFAHRIFNPKISE